MSQSGSVSQTGRRGSTRNQEEKNNNCPDCKKVVGDSDHGLQCEVCELWFHIGCQGITEESYESLKLIATAHWYCSRCDKGVAKILKSLAVVQGKQEKLEKELNEVKKDKNVLRDKIIEVEDEVKKVRELLKETDVKLETLIESKLVEGIDKRVEVKVEAKLAEGIEKKWVDIKVKNVKEDVEESIEIDKRRNNIVFHGVKEQGPVEVMNLDDLLVSDFAKTPDQELVEEILKVGLRIDASRHIEEVQRIGRYDSGKIRPIRVRIRTFEARNEILKRAHNLKDCNEFKKVYIAPDLTRKQQLLDKDLRMNVKKFREEGHLNVKIKGGKVVKSGSENQMVVLYQPAQPQI